MARQNVRARGPAGRRAPVFRRHLLRPAAPSAARVVLELGQNALEAGAGRLRVALVRTRQGLRVALADDGPGVPRAVAAGHWSPSHGLALAGMACRRLRVQNTPAGALVCAKLAGFVQPGDLAGVLAVLAMHHTGPTVTVVLRGPVTRARLRLPRAPGAKQALAARQVLAWALRRTGVETANEAKEQRV